jgi:hypothetical protein
MHVYKIKYLFWVLVLFLLAGCVNRYVLTDENKWEFYANLNEEMNSGSTKVTLLDGDEFSVYSAGVFSEGGEEFLEFYNSSREYNEYPAEVIKRVSVKNRMAGAGQGLLAGIGSGLFLGAVLGFAGVRVPPCDKNGECENYSVLMKAVLFGSIYGVIGGIAGSGVGAIIGSSSYFDFVPPPDRSVLELKEKIENEDSDVIIEEYEE